MLRRYKSSQNPRHPHLSFNQSFCILSTSQSACPDKSFRGLVDFADRPDFTERIEARRRISKPSGTERNGITSSELLDASLPAMAS